VKLDKIIDHQADIIQAGGPFHVTGQANGVDGLNWLFIPDMHVYHLVVSTH